MNRKRVWIIGLVVITLLACVYQIQRYVANRQSAESLNASYKQELAKLDSIGGLVTPSAAGGLRVVIPVKSLTADWLTDTEDSMLLNLAVTIVICGDANSPIVPKIKAMKWYDSNKVEYSSTCP